MSITESDIEKLASLARISISAEEKSVFAKEIDSILGYIEQLNTVSAGSATAPVGPSSTGQQLSAPTISRHRNQLREDLADSDLNPLSDILVKLAPESESGFIKVKKILNQ